MSDTATISDQDVQASLGVITEGVHNRAFFHKLAERGYQPKSAAEAQEMLDLSLKLAETQQRKQDQQSNQSKYASALAALDKMAGVTTPGEEDQIKAAAAELAQDPEIFAAAKTLMAAASA